VTGRKLSIHLNKQIELARQNNDLRNRIFYQELAWMHKRPSMKLWSLDQLVAQYHRKNIEHNIEIVIG